MRGMQTRAHGARVGVLAAIPGELGALRGAARERFRAFGVGLGVCELPSGLPVLTCVSGVGKVRAAAGAAALLSAGVEGLVVVGLAGGLSRGMRTGDVVHCAVAVQADLAVQEDRIHTPDEEWSAAWRAAVPGEAVQFLTADRPVIDPFKRAWLGLRWKGRSSADMETAAVAAVAERAGARWAAMRVLSDRAGFGAGRSFRRHFEALAGRSADTLDDWLPSQF